MPVLGGILVLELTEALAGLAARCCSVIWKRM